MMLLYVFLLAIVPLTVGKSLDAEEILDLVETLQVCL